MKRIAYYLLYLVCVWLFAEGAFRAYYAVRWSQAEILLRPAAIREVYYPGLETFRHESISADNGSLDILLLGASVLDTSWSTVEAELSKRLAADYMEPVRIHNLSVPAHTSLDSRIKYELLAHHHYDLVVLYHGINELRFNNCPDSFFANDYAHIAHYPRVRALAGKASAFSILPHAFQELTTPFQRSRLSKDTPGKEEWLAHGAHIKTADPFYRNYRAIVELAAQHNTPVIMPTFSYHVPADYSIERFEQKQLDYDLHKCAIELWGKPEHVAQGITTHNEVIRSTWENNPETPHVRVVSMHDSLPQNGRFFDDICHLTPTGAHAFVSILYPTVRQALAPDQHPEVAESRKREPEPIRTAE